MSLLKRAVSNQSAQTTTTTTPSENSSFDDSGSSLSLNPIRKTSSVTSTVGSIVAKIPTSATNKIKKTYKDLFDTTSGASLTDGPVTKHFDKITTDVPKNLLDDDDSFDPDDDNLLESPEIPEMLIKGLPLVRVTRKKRVVRTFRIDLEKAIVIWKAHKFMSLDRIVQIRVGIDAKNYREEYGISQDQEDLWASIIYNDEDSFKIKVLHVIASNKKDFELFITTLSHLVSRRRNLMKYLSIPGENFANIHWKKYTSRDDDINAPSYLTFDDILKLTKRLHINCNERLLLRLFQENDKTNKKALDFEEFQTFVKKLKLRPEVLSIFNKYTEAQDNMSFQQFQEFICQEQLQSETSEILTKWFQKFSKGSGFLTVDSFTNFLTSSHSSPQNRSQYDLTRPLNEYYISSSHNTYLIGKQFGNGSSSIEGYIKALQRGCRSLEVDIWDGDSGPVVRHGKLTGFISVRDVLEVIRKHAFILTPFPLIISLEIHCKQEYQIKVRDLLLDVFGDVLVTKPLYPGETLLPSPEDLKHRILVKVKKTPDDNTNPIGNFSSISLNSSAYDETSGGEDMYKSKKFSKKPKRQFKIVSELSDLGIYTQGLRFTNFSLPESKTFNHIFSFSERSFNIMTKDSEKEYLVAKHNRNFLMRIYPSGYRLHSSNFTPLKYWNYGAQMVATNWQTYDLGQQVNEAMFKSGERFGYVLKPERLRNINRNIKFKDLRHPKPKVFKFTIDIISGQLLPRPKELKPEENFSPLVQFELIEPELQGLMKITDKVTNHTSYSSTGCAPTRPVYYNGFNPVWDYRFEGKFKSRNDLTFIRLLVKTGEHPFAVNCFRLIDLKKGYRHIPLYDLNGEEYIFSTLFLNINYEELVK